MATITMNTNDFIENLTKAGMPKKQAEIIARRQESLEGQIVTEKILDLKIELLRKDLLLKLGGIIVVGLIAVTGIILAVLPLLLQQILTRL